MSSFPAFLKHDQGGFTNSRGDTWPPRPKPIAPVTVREPVEREDVATQKRAEPEVEPVSEVPPVYVGGARLVTYGTSPQYGMTVTLTLRDVGPREVHPFKGLKYGKAHGQRLKTWIGPYSELLEINSLPELESVYSGETMNIWFGDTCDKGVVVKIMLDSGPDGTKGVHPFQDLEIGKIEGADLFVSFWAINDDETIIPKKAAGKRTPFHQLSEVRQSNLVVRDTEFVNFLSARLNRLLGSKRPDMEVQDGPTEWAIEVIRLYLDVESRGVMNEDNLDGLEARKRWKTLMSEYFQSDEYHARRHFAR